MAVDVTAGAHDPQLYNEDLAPVPTEKRTWNLWHIAALWVGMCVCIPTYKLASDLVKVGMSWWQGVLTVALANVVVCVPMILNAHAGTKYGIPFPVFARASYGVLGANVPAVMRAIVACGWFGIQTWFGGQAIFELVNTFGSAGPVLATLPDPASAEAASWGFWMALGISPGQLACFLAFWLTNVYFIWKGTESIKWMETLAAPVLIVAGLALLGWAIYRVGSLGTILSGGSRLTGGEFWAVFFPSLTANVGFWATLSLNIPDFSRFARTQRDQVLGQAIGLPPTMALFAFIGVAVTAATPHIFGGEIVNDPVPLMARVGGAVVTLVAMFTLSLATLSTNIAANVVSPANDFSNLRPGKISYKMGGYITAVIGVVMMPWKLLATAGTYLFVWLIGYSALLGPIGGVMVADYFLVRKKHLEVDDLYRRGGAYEYSRGFHWPAIIATAIAIVPNVPGFLYTLAAGGVEGRPAYLATLGSSAGFASAAMTLYDYAWFVGFIVAGALYWALVRPKPVPAR
jgi:NCS1 family nucleobase:cation symporter-1